MKNQTLVNEPTPGEIFRKKHGYSKTTEKLMKLYECATLQEWRKKRKELKKARLTEIRAAKKSKSLSSKPAPPQNSKKKK